jgi:hypothetical protein
MNGTIWSNTSVPGKCWVLCRSMVALLQAVEQELHERSLAASLEEAVHDLFANLDLDHPGMLESGSSDKITPHDTLEIASAQSCACSTNAPSSLTPGTLQVRKSTQANKALGTSTQQSDQSPRKPLLCPGAKSTLQSHAENTPALRISRSQSPATAAVDVLAAARMAFVQEKRKVSKARRAVKCMAGAQSYQNYRTTARNSVSLCDESRSQSPAQRKPAIPIFRTSSNVLRSQEVSNMASAAARLRANAPASVDMSDDPCTRVNMLAVESVDRSCDGALCDAPAVLALPWASTRTGGPSTLAKRLPATHILTSDTAAARCPCISKPATVFLHHAADSSAAVEKLDGTQEFHANEDGRDASTSGLAHVQVARVTDHSQDCMTSMPPVDVAPTFRSPNIPTDIVAAVVLQGVSKLCAQPVAAVQRLADELTDDTEEVSFTMSRTASGNGLDLQDSLEDSGWDAAVVVVAQAEAHLQAGVHSKP